MTGKRICRLRCLKIRRGTNFFFLDWTSNGGPFSLGLAYSGLARYRKSSIDAEHSGDSALCGWAVLERCYVMGAEFEVSGKEAPTQCSSSFHASDFPA